MYAHISGILFNINIYKLMSNLSFKTSSSAKYYKSDLLSFNVDGVGIFHLTNTSFTFVGGLYEHIDAFSK